MRVHKHCVRGVRGKSADEPVHMEYFNRMVMSGVQPDGVSFLGVLVGCSHAGMTSTARKVFDELESVYGVRHELKHYGCMADLVGRAGLIEEAMEMIGEMGMEGDKYVWGGVLGGCRIHGDVEVGEMAAMHLWEIKPDDSGVYSAMASMYANERRWGDVAKMRALMSHENVTKNAAFSSIQVDDRTLAYWVVAIERKHEQKLMSSEFFLFSDMFVLIGAHMQELRRIRFEIPGEVTMHNVRDAQWVHDNFKDAARSVVDEL
ncbi:hypothetical protein J5N97_021475 [Dioscorea zingiberensis]|uniref:Pentatricopeptide repeat-containing protein n=1 Tax=Dioscorea zingiberensis TaxID=325984 RepID=A0A9D5HE96_9LILI|nr:hypothetical protein J5N97_021475 [Dioscorea zingiberensis]